MRVISKYRTIPFEVALIIVSMMTIGIILVEDRVCSKRRVTEGTREEVRRGSLTRWQSLWDQAKDGWWIYRLILDLGRWISKQHGEVNFCLTQFLSGHRSGHTKTNTHTANYRYGYANTDMRVVVEFEK